ncbi:MAG TPA: molybdopterin biosynthesis protein MoeB, partial [Acidimicrobiaceae bacterium]|nr:molybdopterin biosynthesis protein MoeB [Acidimicrobiaceae bacterium]
MDNVGAESRRGKSMPNYGTLLAATKKEIREITTHQAAELLADDYVALDVRDPEEYDQGALVGSLHISRGQLESQIEQRIPETDTKIVVYCAGGARSAFATKTLNELGYSEVVSMMGGFNQWKSDGREWQMPASMTGRQRARYQRHLLLPEIGEEGQQRLLDARVLILGAGGLGSPAALYLAAAGVGTIGIIDMDVVDETNLQRQIIHNTHRVGQSKVESAKQSILALNPDVKVEAIDRQLNVDNALELVADWDVIV